MLFRSILSVNVIEVMEGDVQQNQWGTITVSGNVPEFEYGVVYTLIAKERNSHPLSCYKHLLQYCNNSVYL